MTAQEIPILEPVPEESNNFILAYSGQPGEIEKLAANVGYAQFNEKGNFATTSELGIKSSVNAWVCYSQPNGMGDNVWQGQLGFNKERSRIWLKQTELIIGDVADIEYGLSPNPIRFNSFNQDDKLIVQEGEMYSTDSMNYPRSETRGALQITLTSAYPIVEKHDGKEKLAGVGPGQIGYPPNWGAAGDKLLFVRFCHVFGHKKLPLEDTEIGYGVLQDIRYQLGGEDDKIFGGHSLVKLRTSAPDNQKWIVDRLEPTLREIMSDENFKEAYTHLDQLNRLNFIVGTFGKSSFNPQAAFRSQPQEKGFHYADDIVAMVNKFYAPHIDILTEKVQKNDDQMKLLSLI